MATYRQLISEKKFLKVQQRARALMRDGTDLVAIYYKDNMLIFKTRSGTDRNIIWTQKVEISDVTMDAIINRRSFRDVESLIKNSNLKVACNCLREGTRILTKRGFVEIQNVVAGDFVLSSDGLWHEVFGLRKSELKRNWKSVNIKGQIDPLVVTDDHEILFSTYRDVCACGCGRKLRELKDSYKMSSAYSLFDKRTFAPKHSKYGVRDGFERYQMHSLSFYKLGELLCTPKVLGIVDFDVDYARMLGYYLAEGSIPLKGTTVRFTFNQNEENTLAKDIREYFGLKGVRVKISRCFYKDQKWLNVDVYSTDFRRDCEKFCGKGSLKKFPNPEILSWCTEAKEAFVIGHLLGDGSVDEKFRWLSSSRDLVEMLYYILASLGIKSSVHIANNYDGKIDSKGSPLNKSYAVSVPVNDFYDVYLKYKGLFRDKDLIDRNNSRGRNCSDEFVLSKVLDVSDFEDGYGYDIVLSDEPHNYCANGVVVSNCPAFLYWGFKYIAWRKGYGLEKENRRPVIRNPHQKGFVCFVKGTKVLTPSGYRDISDIKVGDDVFTHKGRIRKVIATSNRLSDDLVSVRYGNVWITGTSNHKVLSEKFLGRGISSTRKCRGSLSWTNIGDLSCGDFLVSPRIYLDHTIDVPLREAFFAGLYAGDGHMNCAISTTGKASVHNNEFRCKGNYIALDVSNEENYKSIFDSYGVSWNYTVSTSILGHTGCAKIADRAINQRCLSTVNFTNSSLGQFKKMSKDIFSWNVDAQWEFVKGFFLADGTVVDGSGSKGNRHTYVTLFNTNESIISTLFILLKQWYDVELKYYDRKPFEEYGRLVECKRMYYIRLTGSDCRDFLERVGEEILVCKGAYKGNNASCYNKSIVNYDGVEYIPKIVKEVRHASPSIVYNIQVEDDESYIVEDIAVHNCKHLFLVMQLYPFWSKALASKFIKYNEGKVLSENSVKNLERVRRNRNEQQYVSSLPAQNASSTDNFANE